MKMNMYQDLTRKWVTVVVAASDKDDLKRFSKLVDAPDWDCENIDFKIVMNGVEFENLDDMFNRLHNDLEKARLYGDLLSQVKRDTGFHNLDQNLQDQIYEVL